LDCIEIEGGVPLEGEVSISGAKNAVLPMMAAAIMAEGRSRLRNVPHLRDIETMSKILRQLGVRAERVQNRILEIEVENESPCMAPYSVVSQMRASICVLGPLLARRGRAQVAMPGGCRIGDRPIDLHLKGMRALGAQVDTQHGDVTAEASRLRGAEIYLGGPYGSTVLGTCNVMCAAALAEGRTVIDCAACEPEVQEVARFLNGMGARIEGIGTKQLVVEGVSRLEGAEWDVIPDRIEAGTFMVAAAITRGNVFMRRCRRDHLGAVIDALDQAGATIVPEDGGLRVTAAGPFRPVDLTTLPYPGLPTDMQAQMMALLSLAEGTSIITERIFPDRFMHVAELNRMRANIRKEGPSSIIVGTDYLSGAPVMATDLRASAALILAGLVARNTSHISEIHHIDRGYENIEGKLARLGARIRRIRT